MQRFSLLVASGSAFTAGELACRTSRRNDATSRRKVKPGEVHFEDIAQQAGLNCALTSTAATLTKNSSSRPPATAPSFSITTTMAGLTFFFPTVRQSRDSPKTKPQPGTCITTITTALSRDVTARAGLARSGWGQGGCVGDYDNDGYLDLFVTYWGQNVLYHNNGDGTFSDVTAKAGLKTSRDEWSTGCSFVDYDRDGKADLFVVRYVDFSYDSVPRPGRGTMVPVERDQRNVRAAGIEAGRECALSQQRRWHVH